MPSLSSQSIALAFGGDDRYAMGLAVAIYSAIRGISADSFSLYIYILDAGLSKSNKARIARAVKLALGPTRRHHELAFLSINASCFDPFISSQKYLNSSAYMRLLLPDLVGEHSQVLYIDSDILVKGDIFELATMAVPNNIAAGACVDPIFSNFNKSGLCHICPELNLEPSSPYFNTGVLLLNLDALRSVSFVERAMQFLASYGELLNYADQDVFNAVLVGQLMTLERHWNCFAFHDSHASSRLIHFVGPRKPWVYLYSWKPLWLGYSLVVLRTGWFNPFSFALWFLLSSTRALYSSITGKRLFLI